MANPISSILIVAILAVVVIVILTGKLNRAVAALGGALLAIAVMLFIEGKGFTSIVGYIVGGNVTSSGGLTGDWVNVQAIFLIIGITIIMQIAQSSGLFQFFAFNIIKFVGKDARRLLITIDLLSVLMAGLLNSLLSCMILIPLIALICNILSIDAKPYILSSGIITKLGATFFSFSSVENILISSSEHIPFTEYFLTIGVIGVILIVPTVTFYYFYYQNKITNPKGGSVEILKQFDAFTFIPNKGLLYKSLTVFIAVIACFVVIPPTLVSPDIIAITGAAVLLLVSKLNASEIFAKVNIQLVFYLLGIFVITGALQDVGVINLIGKGFGAISGGNALATTLVMLWIPAYIASVSDPTAICKIMIPVAGSLAAPLGSGLQRAPFVGLNFACNLGDSLSAMGDNMVVLSLATANKTPCTVKEITIIGFLTANLQLFTLTVIFTFTIQPGVNWVIGVILIAAFFGALAAYMLRQRIVRVIREKAKGKNTPKETTKPVTT